MMEVKNSKFLRMNILKLYIKKSALSERAKGELRGKIAPILSSSNFFLTYVDIERYE